MTIFLDIDGVLNRHKRHPNGYCPLVEPCVARLSFLLGRYPHVRLVISSAWRYMMERGDLSCRGLEYIFQMANATSIEGRIDGWTETDEQTCERLGICELGALPTWEWLEEHGGTLRALQIESYAQTRGILEWLAVDDLPMDLPARRFVRAHPMLGLDALASLAIQKRLDG